MKKVHYILASALVVVLFFASCKKEEDLNVDFSKYNADTYVKGPLDEWLEKEFLDPYNISVVYRWDRYLSPINKEITPPKEEKIQPAMEALNEIWIKPYMEIGGAAFFKPIVPKQIVLVGSAEYNTNGTITLGTAEGGRKIYLTVINSFDKKNGVAVKRMMRTVHHEFTHIINQVVSIPPEFNTISPEFTGNWATESAAVAKSLGFISQYARNSPTEDFAEMVSHLLVEGQPWFDVYVASASASAQARLREKEQIVIDYFNLSFGIDFKVLQENVQEKIAVVSPPPTFEAVINNGDLQGIAVGYNQLSEDNKTRMNQAASAVAALPYSLTLSTDFDMVFVSPTKVQLQHVISQGGSDFPAYFDFDVEVASDGTTKFTSVSNRGAGGAYDNASLIKGAMAAWHGYITSNVFEGKFANSAQTLGGFYLKNNPASYFTGEVAY